MWQVSDTLRAALDAQHEMTTEVYCLRAGVATLIETVGVDCAATLGTQGARSATVRVDQGVIDDGWLDPLQDEVLIRTGVRGVGDIPLFYGRVDEVPDDSGGDVEATLMSRAEEIVRAGYEVPFPSKRGAFATDEIARVVHAVNGAWEVSIDVGMDASVPTAVWEDDPGEALDALAGGINAMWMPDRVGGFSVFTNPYTLAVAPDPVMVLEDGADGVFVHVRHARARGSIRNSITVVVERTDGFAPIRVTVRDTDASSPTRWGGVFGKQNEVVKTQLPLTRAAATLIAQRRLTQSLALARSWTLTMPPGVGQLLDPGDVVAVRYRDEVTAQVIESIRYATTSESSVVADTRVFRTVTSIPES